MASNTTTNNTATTHSCPSPTCPSTFATPSDLRFHTLTAHLPTNTSTNSPLYICTLPLPHTPIGHCDIFFPSSGKLAMHLQDKHGISAQDTKNTLETHTIGPTTGRFWCGFCRGMVSVRLTATYGVEKCGDGRDGTGAGGRVEGRESVAVQAGRWCVARTEHVQAHFLGWNGVVAGNDLWVELRAGVAKVGERELGEK